MKKKLYKITAIIMAVITLISVLPLTVSAAGQTTISLKHSGDVYYTSGWGRYFVKMQADGKMVYCVQPDKDAPPEGTYSTSDKKLIDITSSDSKYAMYRKALYYCYGGDGFKVTNNAFKTDTSNHQVNKSGNTPEAFMSNLKTSAGGFNYTSLSNTNLYYMYSHLVLAYINYGASTYKSKMYGLIPEYGYYNQVTELYNAIKSAKTPPIATKIYLMNIGSKYQQVIITRNSIKLQLKKTSSNTDLTEGNSCYSLEGAEYGIYLDKSCSTSSYFGYIKTDKNGFGVYGGGKDSTGNHVGSDVPVQSYYAKETKAPKGYSLDKTIYTFKNSGNKTVDGTVIYSFSCADRPMNDPVTILLKKQDAETGEVTDKLAGAEFRISYYDGYYKTEKEIKKLNPVRSWVIKTDDYGLASLADDCLVSGDPFYYSSSANKEPCLPFGTITIQEIKAPQYYALNPDLFIGQITEDGGLGWLTTNELTPEGQLVVPEPKADQEGYIRLTKLDAETAKKLAGATFGVYSTMDADNNGKLLAVNRVSEIVTGSDGTGISEKLKEGTYYLQEEIPPDGYVLDLTVHTVELKLTDGETTVNVNITNNQTQTVITKKDITGTKEVIGAELEVTDIEGNVIDNWISTSEPHIIKGLSSGQKYILTEKTVPDGYVKAESIIFEVQSGTVVEMKDDTTKIRFSKVDDLNNPVTGAVLQVLDNVTKNVIAEWTTNDEAYELCGVLGVGKTYILREKSVPIGYEKAKDLTFVVKDTADYQTVSMQDYLLGSFYVKKYADDNNIENIWFKVTSPSGYDKNFRTDGKGSIYVEGVRIYDSDGKKITYTVSELGLKTATGEFAFPDKYINVESQTITLIPNNSEILSFHNTTKKGSIKIIKSSYDGIVKDLWFRVTDVTDAKAPVVLGNYKTDDDGLIFLENLDVYALDAANDSVKRQYKVEELGESTDGKTFKFPSRYIKPAPITNTIVYNGTTEFKFDNKHRVYDNGRVVLSKKDGNNNDYYNSSVKFRLFQEDGTPVTLSQNGIGMYVSAKNGKANLDLTLNSIKSNAYASLTVTNLAYGKYYFLEVSTSSDRIPYENKIEFTVSEDNASAFITVNNPKRINVMQTGGSGTGIFYYLSGSFFVLALLFIRYSRKKNGIKKTFSFNKNIGGKKMKKKFTRIITALILAVMIVFTAVPFASAAATPLDANRKVSIKVNCAKSGYTFNLYRVADLTSTTSPYKTTYEPLVPQIESYVNAGNTSNILKALDELTDMPDTVVEAGTFTSTTTVKAKTFGDLEQGIYYIKAVNYPAGVTSVTNSVLALPYYNNGWVYEYDEINLATKVLDDTPTTKKEITNSTKNNVNYTDVSYGDTVDFEIKSTTAGSKTMHLKSYVIYDNMSKGLTLNQNSFNVALLKSDGSKITDLDKSEYKVTITPSGANTLFSVALTSDYLDTDEFYGEDVKYTSLTYSANLNQYAVVGKTGNPNEEVKLEYSNKNGVTSEVKGNTVYVYTYVVAANKVDETGKALTEAAFDLCNDEKCTSVIATGISDAEGKVVFKNAKGVALSLASGTYYIKETAAPEGYNTYGDVIPIKIDVSYSTTFTNGSYVVNEPTDGVATVTIKNSKIITPQTGGMGTIIFYVCGVSFFVGSAIFFTLAYRVKKKNKRTK